MAAAPTPLPHDYIVDWISELERIAPEADSLPATARRAVLTTLASYEAEDGLLPQPAEEARRTIAATLAAPHTPTSPHSLAETVRAALTPKHQREPSTGPAHAA